LLTARVNNDATMSDSTLTNKTIEP